MGRLQDRIALVTGGGTGLGEAIAQRFHQEGATVAINDIDKAAAERVAGRLGGVPLPADVSDPEAVAEMFRRVKQEHGRLDVVVNNAGISGIEGRPELIERFNHTLLRQTEELMTQGKISTHWDMSVRLSDEDWRRVIAVHLDGTFFCCREALRIMNDQMAGSIINMGSIMGTAGGAGATPYCAAKAGILGLTRSLAREVASRGIRVNAIAPGWIETAMTEPLEPSRGLIAAQTPLGRLGQVDDIAWAAVYLASDEAGFVTGQVLSPNGGWHMSQ